MLGVYINLIKYYLNGIIWIAFWMHYSKVWVLHSIIFEIFKVSIFPCQKVHLMLYFCIKYSSYKIREGAARNMLQEMPYISLFSKRFLKVNSEWESFSLTALGWVMREQEEICWAGKWACISGVLGGREGKGERREGGRKETGYTSLCQGFQPRFPPWVC